jgi:hypothetical protein
MSGSVAAISAAFAAVSAAFTSFFTEEAAAEGAVENTQLAKSPREKLWFRLEVCA